MKKTQKEIVLEVVKKNQPCRTEEVKIKSMYEGVSCADRFLRWLQNDGIIESYKCAKDKTKTWRLANKLNEVNGQLQFI